MKKTLLLILLCLSMALLLWSNDKPKLSTISGNIALSTKGSVLMLNVADATPSAYKLVLLSQEALDSLKIEKQALLGSAEVKGMVFGTSLIVHDITKGDKKFVLRDENSHALAVGKSQINISASKCISCRLCVSKCPVGAISMQKGKAVIDSDKCVECGICIEGIDKFRGCPVGAIAPQK